MAKVRFGRLKDDSRLKDSDVVGGVIPPHGPNALFNTPGLEPGVMSAMVQPVPGLMGHLERIGNVQRSMYYSPYVLTLTGQTATTGNEPTESCDTDVKTSGSFKVARQTRPFGEFTRKSKPIVIDRMGMLVNRSEVLDLRFINNPFTDVGSIQGLGINPNDLFRNAYAKAILEELNALRRDYCGLIYTGDKANTSGNTGGYLEYDGLDLQVNDSQTDHISGASISALNSLIVDMSGAIIQNDAENYVARIVEVIRAQQYLAEQTKLDPVEWALVMRYQTFLSLTDVWPCVYMTYRCETYLGGDSAGRVVVDGSEQIRMRDDMRRGRYLLVDGAKIPVILDDCLPEQNVGGGNFESDIYLLPIRTGATSGPEAQLLYLDWFNYRGPDGAIVATQEMGPQDEYRITPDGRFIIHFPGGMVFCKQAYVRTAYRLILRAPFLAARILNVRYNVLFHERSPFPGTSFFQNGGSTSFLA